MSSVAETPPEACDLLVIGAGPAGATLAAHVKRRAPSARVVLVDRAAFPRDKACGDGIGPLAAHAARELGLGEFLAGQRPIETLTVVGPSGGACSGPLPSVKGAKPEGYVILRRTFDAAVRDVALQNGVRDASGWAYVDAERNAATGTWTARLRAPASAGGAEATVHTHVLVGADGARSRVRRTLGVDWNAPRHQGVACRVYGRIAAGADVPLELDFIRSLLPAYGWLFPVSDTLVNVGVGIDAERYEAGGRSLHELLEQYQEFLGGRFEIEYVEGSHAAYMLPYASRLPRLAHEGAALIGDAGSMVNPMTGEGIGYAMVAATLLAEQIAPVLEDGGDVQPALDRYETRFRARFERHFRANARLKRMSAMPFWFDATVRAFGRWPDMLGESIELMMGDGRRLKAWNAVKIGWMALLTAGGRR